MKKPIIGITLDWEDSHTYSKTNPWYALRTNYASVISDHNGIAITLPYDLEAVDQYIDMIDGLMLTGGDYDLDPSVYGEEAHEKLGTLRNNRTEFEMALVKAALAKNKPILAICAGEQLMAAMYGGTLIQDIGSLYPDALEHEQRHLNIPMSKASHKIKVMKDTLLHKIVQADEIEVNSSHHQAVKSVGKDMIISSISIPDNIIESIEMPQYPFVLCVEWHPEFISSKADSLIIEAFVQAAKKI
jgi:putative glutamine amidotransferase